MKRKVVSSSLETSEDEVSLHEDKKYELSSTYEVSTMDEETKQCVFTDSKWIHFCCGEHGIIPWEIDEANCKAFCTMHWTVLTFCVLPHCTRHPAENQTHGYANMSFAVSYDDILCFMLFADGHAEGIGLQQATKYHHTLVSTEVNFCTVLKMFEFFQTNLQHPELLISFLKEQRSFNSAVSCLSAYSLVKQKLTGVPTTILYQSDFQLVFRLKMAVKHGFGGIFYNAIPLDHDTAAKALDIQPSLLKQLSSKTCVLAGGAALRLGHPSAPFTNRSDVDFFVLNTPTQKTTVLQLVGMLRKTNRLIYRLGESVLTAIGEYGVRRIQIILSTAKTAEELISQFDFGAISCYFDGHCLHATAAAHLSWLTSKCVLNTNCRQIVATRLFGMHCKGFKLSKKCLSYLENSSIGWPVRPEIQLVHKHAIPFLLDTEKIPQDVQDANLQCGFKLSRLLQIHDKSVVDDMKAFDTSQGAQDYTTSVNVFGGFNIIDYVETACTLAEKSSTFKKKDGYKMCVRLITSDYVFCINPCSIRGFCEEDQKYSNNSIIVDDDDSTSNIKKQPFISKMLCVKLRNVQLWKDITQRIPEYFAKTITETDLKNYRAEPRGNENQLSFYVKYSNKTTTFYENGFPVKSLPQMDRGYIGKIMIYPSFLYISGYDNSVVVKWKCTQIHWCT